MQPGIPPLPGATGTGSGVSVRYLPEGEEITFRPTGCGRLLVAGFLGFWLCGWAAGEATVIAILLYPLVGETLREALPELARKLPAANGALPWPVLAFLVVWLAFWTVGGLAAIRELLRLLAGRDVFVLLPGGFSARSGAGPFGRTRVVRAGEADDVRVRRHDGLLVLVEGTRETVLTQAGDRTDREWLRDRLRAALGMASAGSPPGATDGVAASEPPLPPGWEARPLADGCVALGKSASDERKATGCAVVVAALWAAGAGWLLRRAGPLPDVLSLGGAFAALLLVSTLLAVLLGAWVALVREEWRVARGSIEWVRLVRGKPWRRTSFPDARLVVEYSKDSDDDEWFDLRVTSGAARRSVKKVMNQPRELVALARWLSYRSGRPVAIPDEALG